MSVILDLTLSPEAMVYKLLTTSTPKLPTNYQLSASDLTLSAVAAVTGRPDGHNTSILVTPVSSSTTVYGNPKTVYYTRKDLGTVFVEKGLSLALTDDLNNWTASTAPATVLALFQAELTPFLTANDLSVSPPVTNQDGTISTSVAMAAGHLTLIGSVTIVTTAAESRTSTDEIPDAQPGLS